jgi:hypothetical protein
LRSNLSRHPAHAPSLGIDRSGRASRISGWLPCSAKCPALYGLVKAGIAHTSGRPSKGAEQSGTSCFKVPRSAAQRALDAGRASFHDVRVQRACLQTNPLTQRPRRMAPALPGIPHWEFFFGLFPFFTYYSLSYEVSRAPTSRGGGFDERRGPTLAGVLYAGERLCTRRSLRHSVCDPAAGFSTLSLTCLCPEACSLAAFVLWCI